ncbi:D-amino acid dehydrogenase [Pararhodospirillum oryzae]|uniref:D-amino-acid dehydrogenase n=1 Tax=Pararhodospirillum oryzae TaxID=478448 RepID=A0A512H8T9_9PROT|nr:D-amino acid dehydrogenase [Pararhodospirillum oryzae]GEO81865.1 D-amino-acid dehydrogenase [Pararhodospirillum oryzae]
MSVIVLGAGVVGVTTAWTLARAGHAVTVLDRRPGAGLETSFANGGQISVCHTQPWAGPEAPRQILGWLGRADAPLVVHPWRWDPPLWAWGVRFLANCRSTAFERNMERAIRLALYSRSCLKALRAETGIEYDQKTQGILKIYRSAEAFAAGKAAREAALAWGLEQRVLDADACVALEPALVPARGDLAGGILAPEDESGDAHRFTVALAERAQALGARFCFGTQVLGLVAEGGRIKAVRTDQGDQEADWIVLALGSESPRVARSIGVRLPVYPAKGYSITVPVEPASVAPVVSITDEERKMVYSRLGTRLRAAGTAELSGWNTTLRPERVDLIRRETRALFPNCGDVSAAQGWCGLRPTTPDSVPLLGPVPGYANLVLNTGHGTLGWTMACGSARVVADCVEGRPPAVSLDGLGLDRFGTNG